MTTTGAWCSTLLWCDHVTPGILLWPAVAAHAGISCLLVWRIAWPGRARAVSAYAIGTVAMFWVIERVLAFVG